jgi:LmbE family N-acetylglucosaminyl deacetylase
MTRVLVLCPHPDDEAIGCGGTLRKHAVAGDEVRVVFLTSGEKGGHGRPADETARVREQEAKAAADLLGSAGIEFWRQPDGDLRTTPELGSRLGILLTTFCPTVVYVPHDREMHPDHRAAAELLRVTLAGLDPYSGRPEVRMFEVWTPLESFDHVEDISEFIDAKIAAVRAHASQCAVMRFDEAVLGLNRYRGEMHSWPGGDYAEVFRGLP